MVHYAQWDETKDLSERMQKRRCLMSKLNKEAIVEGKVRVTSLTDEFQPSMLKAVSQAVIR